MTERMKRMSPHVNFFSTTRFCCAMCRTALSTEPSGPRSAKWRPRILVKTHVYTVHSWTVLLAPGNRIVTSLPEGAISHKRNGEQATHMPSVVSSKYKACRI